MLKRLAVVVLAFVAVGWLTGCSEQLKSEPSPKLQLSEVYLDYDPLDWGLDDREFIGRNVRISEDDGMTWRLPQQDEEWSSYLVDGNPMTLIGGDFIGVVFEYSVINLTIAWKSKTPLQVVLVTEEGDRQYSILEPGEYWLSVEDHTAVWAVYWRAIE